MFEYQVEISGDYGDNVFVFSSLFAVDFIRRMKMNYINRTREFNHTRSETRVVAVIISQRLINQFSSVQSNNY